MGQCIPRDSWNQARHHLIVCVYGIHFVIEPRESWIRMAVRHEDNLKTAKSFGPRQPARTAQADMGRYFFRKYIKPAFHKAQLISV